MKKSDSKPTLVVFLKYFLPVVGGTTDRWVNFLQFSAKQKMFDKIIVISADTMNEVMPENKELSISGVEIIKYKNYSRGIFRYFGLLDADLFNFVFNISLSKRLEEEGDLTIVTSSAPYSIHLFGWYLKKKRPVRWVADFRDQCYRNPHRTKLEKLLPASKKLKLYYERFISKRADKIVLNTKINMEEFKGDHPDTACEITYCYNGFLKYHGNLDKSGPFRMLYYGGIRNDKTEFGFRKFVNKFKNDIDIDIFSFERPKIDGVNWKGFVANKDEEVKIFSCSNYIGILSLSNVVAKGWVPQKIYFFMKYKIPFIIIDPSDELKKICTESNAGTFVFSSEIEKLDLNDLLQNLSNYSASVSEYSIENNFEKVL